MLFLTAEAVDRSSANGEVDCLMAITSRHGGHHLLSAVARPMTAKKLERQGHNHDDLGEFDGASLVMLHSARNFLLGLLTCVAAPLALSQGITTGTVSGVVTDQSGAVVPGAQIQIANLATGVKLDQKSAADGSFKFFLVPIGTYNALITANGFAIEDVNNVQVVSGATSSLNEVKLHVATAQAEEVEVNGSAASLLETTDSQVTTTFNAETMANLPLNNGFDTVAELIPGVVAAGADSFSNSNGDNFSVNGQSSRYNNYEIDGQSNNDNTVGGTLVFFGSQDAIQQIQVISN